MMHRRLAHLTALIVGALILASSCTELGLPRTSVAVASPDRRFVAFVRNHPSIDPPDQSVWLTDRSGTTSMLRRLGADTEWCNRIVWSADSATVGFLVMNARLDTYDVETRRLRTSVWLNGNAGEYPPTGTVTDLSLSPDGRTASFTTCARGYGPGPCSPMRHVRLTAADEPSGVRAPRQR
jgi:hypothetical protein